MSTADISKDELDELMDGQLTDEVVEKLANALDLVHKDDLGDLDGSEEAELEAYGTGVVDGTELTGGLSRSTDEILASSGGDPDPDDDLGEYGTGEMGDTTRTEYRREQKKREEARLVAEELEGLRNDD